MIATALTALASWVGSSGRHKDPAARRTWAQILLPHDPIGEALRYLEAKGAEEQGKIPTSTCALVVVRYFAALGCRCNEHAKAYVPRAGAAVADVQRIAQRHGAWRTSVAELGVYPAPGDILCMRVANPHLAVVVDSRAHDAAILSIDGGQGDNTWTRRRERTFFAPDGEIPFLIDLDDGESKTIGRKSALYARVDTAQIARSLEKCR